MGVLDRLLGQPDRPVGLAAEHAMGSGRIRLAAQRIEPGIRPDRRTQARVSKRSGEQWNAYESIGEIGYVIDLFGNALRRVRVFPAGVDDAEQGRVPLDECSWAGPQLVADATAALERVRSVEHGQGEVLAGMAVNLKVAGAGNLHAVIDPQTQMEDWRVVSTEALVYQRGQWVIKDTPDDKRPLPVNLQTDPIWRFWQRHPRWPGIAYSEMSRVLGHAENLQILERAARNRARSRAAGAGILVMSNRYKLNGRRTPNGQQGGDVFDDLMTAGTSAIDDEAAVSAFMPIMADFDVEDARKVMHHITLDRPLSEIEEKREDKLLRRIAQGLDAPPELITGMADLNHWCVDDSTEVLTRGGWVTQDRLEVGDEILALDHQTGLARWSPVRDIYRAAVVDEPMVSIEMGGHSSLTTPNHRWPVAGGQWRTTETLREPDRLITAAPSEAPAEAKWSDALVELVGWFWTEGSIQGRSVTISQSHTVNPDRVARIRRSLTDLAGPAGAGRWRESIQSNASSYGGPVTVFHLPVATSALLLDVAPAKRPTPDFIQSLTAAQLALFIDVSLQGDGWHYRQGRLDCFARDRDMLDALELAGVLAGFAVTTSPAGPTGHRVNLARKTTVRPVKAHRAAVRQGRTLIEDTRYTGTIWCPVTDESTWCARRRGTVYFTGNTAWQVESSTYEAHIEPLALRIADILAVAVVRSALLAAGHAAEVVARVLVGVDPSDLVRRPDPSKDADDAHSALVISDAAYRKAKGFTDDDAPNAEELLRRMALKRGITTEQLTAELLSNYAGADVSRTLAKGDAQTAESVANTDGDDQADDGEEPAATSPEALTSSAAGQLGPRLQAIDDQLTARLSGAVEVAVAHALQRATSRAANRARGKGLAATIRQGGPGLLHRLGAAGVAELGLDADELVTDADFDELRNQWGTWVADAYQAGEREVTTATGQPVDVQADSDIDAGWALLAGGLLAATREALTRDPNAPAGEILGEHDPTATVDHGLIRNAMAVAGGAHGQSTDGGAVLLDAGTRPAGGIATGEHLTQAARDAGLQLVGHTWRVGAPSVPYPPHHALADIDFTDLNDPRLANESGAWPGNSHWHPQDHRGCRCTAEPRWAPISAN